MTTAVKYFDNTMASAPALSNVAGTLVAVLDACLVTGFGSVTLSSLVIVDNVATATVSAGHNFTMVGATGPVLKIEGATPSGLNGDWRVTVTSLTQFTFATTGITNQTATGTISAKRAPAGFEKAFTGTNKAAYRSDDVTGTRLYLRVDDSTTTYARIRGYETMSDVDTGAGLFPTDTQLSGGGYVYKATLTNRDWRLFSDGRMVYFFCDATGNASYQYGFVFGDGLSYVNPDAFGAQIIAANAATGALPLYSLTSGGSTGTYAYLARSYTQIGESVGSYRYSHSRSTQMGGQGQVYPALTGAAAHFWPVEYWEGDTIARGLYPGLWNPLHAANPPHGTVIESIQNLPGRTLLVQKTSNHRMGLDVTGPWR